MELARWETGPSIQSSTAAFHAVGGFLSVTNTGVKINSGMILDNGSKFDDCLGLLRKHISKYRQVLVISGVGSNVVIEAVESK